MAGAGLTAIGAGTEPTTTSVASINAMIGNLHQRLVGGKENVVKATNVMSYTKEDGTTQVGSATLVDDASAATRPRLA